MSATYTLLIVNKYDFKILAPINIVLYPICLSNYFDVQLHLEITLHVVCKKNV